MTRNKQVDPDRAQIVEIGSHTIMKAAFPDRTRSLCTYRKPIPPYDSFSFRTAWEAWRAIRAGQIDLIVVWASPYAPWNFRELKAVFGRPFRPLQSLVRILGVQSLRFLSTTIPIVAIDNEDARTIAPHNMFLLDRAKWFFKRELPIDRWQVFQHTAHAGIPGARFRTRPANRMRIAKLRPISIGVTRTTAVPQTMPIPPKTADVFVALTLEGGTSVRNEGIAQLRRLAAEGFVVDVAETRLEHSEYRERMSRAWLTWSPEGLGWDCFRHYEAPLAHSVPVINTPTIVRYRPLLDGVHAVYYYADDPDSLGQKIRAALCDKEGLLRMAQAARLHVLQYHLRPRPFADAILAFGLGLEEPPSGVALPELGYAAR
jgi:hypothetical protein